MMQRSRDDRSIGELLGDLYRGASNMIHLEIEIAKTEMSQKASRVGKNVGFLAAGGAIAYAGFLALLAAAIAALAMVMPVWVAALIVGVVVVAIGGILVWSGLRTLQQESAAPQKTIQTIREDQEWIKDQTR